MFSNPREDSQRQKGWRAIGAHYDDGRYSGGTMERHGLKRHLVEMEAREVDTRTHSHTCRTRPL